MGVCVCELIFVRVCGQTAHEPCTCEEWKNWLSKVNEMRIKIGKEQPLTAGHLPLYSFVIIKVH